MDTKHYSPTPDPVFKPTEPGFLVDSHCGRQWYVTLEAVGADYADFLHQVDKISLEEATAISEKNREFWPTWFAEQCYEWSDIERLGKIVRRSSRFKTKKALDGQRSRSVQDYEEFGIRTPL